MPSVAPFQRFEQIVGVDFSGASKAGELIFVARCDLDRSGRLLLRSLDPLSKLSGTIERTPALRWLVDSIRMSHRTLWGIDFPFGLPVELGWRDWPAMMHAIGAWPDGAATFGRRCVEIARSLGGKLHIRRDTDRETATPFDCYHYRIIYQLFHGMREVLAPLRGSTVCVAPFELRSKPDASSVVVEACPGSTLRRLKLPHNLYKQPAGGALDPKRRANRRKILDGLAPFVAIEPTHVRTIMRNPGGDALDAVVAAVGVWSAWTRWPVDVVTTHDRYPREGLVYC